MIFMASPAQAFVGVPTFPELAFIQLAADPALLHPPARELVDAIEIREVSPLVNRVSNNGPRLLDPVE